jgi:hypothetical protein
LCERGDDGLIGNCNLNIRCDIRKIVEAWSAERKKEIVDRRDARRQLHLCQAPLLGGGQVA